jgi:hypothetical protein
MAFDMDNLGGHVTEVIRDTRTITDPWGFGISAEVLRYDHPDWKRWELDLAADKPVAEKIRRVTTEAAFSEMAPSGYRKSKKLSRSEAHQKMVRQIAEKDTVTTDIDDLREKKPGIAEILIKSMTVQGETSVICGGVEHDLTTPEGRLSFMLHTSHEFQAGGEKKFRAVPVYKKRPDGEYELDEFGDPIEARYGGWNTGDAVAALAMEESKDLASFVEKQKVVVLQPSNDTSSGSIGTGSPEELPSED